MATPLNKEMEMMKQNVQTKFDHIREALGLRERLLLRQIDVISTSTQQMTRASPATQVGCDKDADASQEVRFLTENEDQLLAAIRSYGKFNLDSINLALQDLYMRNEDYITPTNDHETMYKCLHTEQLVAATGSDATAAGVEGEEQQRESIIVDFSRSKSLIENNVSHMNESIVNITVAEAKALIRKAKSNPNAITIPSLNLDELDDGQESSITDVSSLEKQRVTNSKPGLATGCTEIGKKPKKQRFKPNITINSCNGTINLGNVENLTINCSSEEALSSVAEGETCSSATGTETPVTTTSSDNGGGGTNSNNSSNTSSRSQSQKHKHTNNTTKTDADKKPTAAAQHTDANDSDGADAVHCEFYNRLLNEIKNQLKQKSAKVIHNAQHFVVAADSSSDSKLNSNLHSCPSHGQASPPGKPLVLKNLENLKVILESNGADSNGSADESFHPVQIEQWLAEIISTTDLEPMQNTDILEHSRLHKKSMSINVVENI